jgi:hypothetical protein
MGFHLENESQSAGIKRLQFKLLSVATTRQRTSHTQDIRDV